MQVKVTRVNSGIYDVDIGGRTFCIERTDAGDEWILKEEKTFGDGYIDHFRTKRSALEYLRSIKGARVAATWCLFPPRRDQHGNYRS